MARSIDKVFEQYPTAKMLVVVGNLHALKRIEWEENVPNAHGFIRSYLKQASLKAFSIVQCIDESPDKCDFTREFSHIEGTVAIDCDERFAGWKIGILAPVAAKQTNVCNGKGGQTLTLLNC